MGSNVYIPLKEAISQCRTHCDGKDNSVDAGQVISDMCEMCSLLKPHRVSSENGSIYEALYAWYMPRNEEHTWHFMGRYKALSGLQDMVINRIKERSE